MEETNQLQWTTVYCSNIKSGITYHISRITTTARGHAGETCYGFLETKASEPPRAMDVRGEDDVSSSLALQ